MRRAGQRGIARRYVAHGCEAGHHVCARSDSVDGSLRRRVTSWKDEVVFAVRWCGRDQAGALSVRLDQPSVAGLRLHNAVGAMDWMVSPTTTMSAVEQFACLHIHRCPARTRVRLVADWLRLGYDCGCGGCEQQCDCRFVRVNGSSPGKLCRS